MSLRAVSEKAWVQVHLPTISGLAAVFFRFDVPFTSMDHFVDASCPDAPYALHWRNHSVPARFLHVRLEAIYRLHSSSSVDGDLIWSMAYEVSIFLM